MLIISDSGLQFISNKTQSFVNSRGTKWYLIYPMPLGGVAYLNDTIHEKMFEKVTRTA